MRKLTAIQIALGTLAGAALVTTGAIAGLKYWTGSDFSPSGTSRELKSNQVLFQQEPDPKATSGEDGQEDSSRWEKQDDAEKQESPQVGEGNFLFQTNQNQQAGVTGGVLMKDNANSTSTGVDGGDLNGPSFVVTPGTSNSGSSISGDIGKLPGDSGKEDPITPTQPGGESIGPGADVVVNGEPDDKIPGHNSDPYTEKNNNGKLRLTVSPALNKLRSGQTVTEKMLFLSMDVFFGEDFAEKPFYLDWEQYGDNGYFRIKEISFDGGNTWHSVDELPLKVPSKAKIKIKVDYRFSTNDEWTTDEEVDYGEAAGSTVYVLSKIPEDPNASLDLSLIINYVFGCNPDVGSEYNLIRLIKDQMKACGALNSDETVNKLFPGWWENGQRQPWFYPVTEGRHVLLPGTLQPIPEGCSVILQTVYLDEIGLCDLQMIVKAPQDQNGTVQVPLYVQGVKLDELGGDVLAITDEVLEIRGNSAGIQKAYTVDEGNAYFSAPTSGNLAGVLMNKAETKIMAIPAGMEALTVPNTVEEIAPLSGHGVKALTLLAEKPEELPELGETLYENGGLESLTVRNEEILLALLRKEWTDGGETHEDWEKLANCPDLVIHCQSLNRDFRIYNGCLLTEAEDGKSDQVWKILSNDSLVILPEGVVSIRKDACLGKEYLEKLVLPTDGTVVTLEENALAGVAEVLTVCCESTEQEQALRAAGTVNENGLLSLAGAENVKLEGLNQTEDGYVYLDNGDETVTLIRAPKDVVEFNGVEGLDISIVAGDCFANCTSLKWVTLPGSTVTLETNAFRNCTALEGVLIQGDWDATFAERCFDGCSSLRFVAVNGSWLTPCGNMGRGIPSTCRFAYLYSGLDYSSEGWSGYNCEGFRMEPVGSSRILYCMVNGVHYSVVASGRVMPDRVELRDTVVEFLTASMVDCVGEHGSFTIDWESLPHLSNIFNNAFYRSALAGDVTIVQDEYIVDVKDDAFGECQYITGFSVKDTATLQLGANVFWNCTSLKEVHLGGYNVGYLQANLFSACTSLETIYLPADEPGELSLFTVDHRAPYYFDADRQPPDTGLRIVVKPGLEERYINAWRVRMSGYPDLQFMKERLGCADTGTNEKLEQQLLEGENALRTLLGMERAETLRNYFPYVLANGKVTLTGAPGYLTELRLDSAELGIEKPGTLNYLGTNAFSDCKDLKTVTVPEVLDGIYNNAFQGSGVERLVFETTTAPELILSGSAPFSFGTDMKVTIAPPGLTDEEIETVKLNFLYAWRCPMMGYADEQALRNALSGSLSGEDLEKQVAKTLRDGENVVRAMLDMDLLPEDAAPSDGYRITVENGVVTLIGIPNHLEDASGVLTLPSEIQGKTIHAVAAGAFADCKELKTLVIPPQNENAALTLERGAFEGTENLTVELQGSVPVKLQAGESENYFGGTNLTFRLEEGNRKAWVDGWKYSIGGYANEKDLKDKNRNDEYVMNGAQQIKQELLRCENAARALLGMEEVGYPSGFYDIEWLYYYISLTHAPTELVEADIGAGVDYLPDDGYSVLAAISGGAFDGCDRLETIRIPDTVFLLGNEAFRGAKSGVTLIFESVSPPGLDVDWMTGTFSFGTEIGKIIVPEGCQQAYLDEWLAYLDGTSVEETQTQMMEENGWNEMRAYQEAQSRHVAIENYLRGLLEMDLVEDPLTHFAYTEVRNGIRLDKVPTYVETITLDKETMGLEKDWKLLEINADSFENCDLLKKVTAPNTVDAITSMAFTCATESLTLDMTDWDKEKTPPVLVLLDMDGDGIKEPFAFGLTRENAQVTVLVRDEETRKNFVNAWAPYFAGAESRETLVQQILGKLLTADMTDEERAQARITAENQADEQIQNAKNRLNDLITVPKPAEEVPSAGSETE